MSKKKNRHHWSSERLVVRNKSGNIIGEWNRGSKGYVEKFRFASGIAGRKGGDWLTGKRTHHKSGKVHLHFLFAKGGKRKSWL